MVKGITGNAVMLDGVMKATDNPQYPYQYQLINADDNRIMPIPLSDDLLQKIASRIEIKGKRVYRYTKTATFFISKDDDGYFIGMMFRDQLIHITPKHIDCFHQLQNIHFSQYGMEFDFNENHLIQSIKTLVDEGLI